MLAAEIGAFIYPNWLMMTEIPKQYTHMQILYVTDVRRTRFWSPELYGFARFSH